MIQRWFLFGVMFLLIPPILSGCGISQEQYAIAVSDLSNTQQDLQSVKAELSTVQSELDAKKVDLVAKESELETMKDEKTSLLAEITDLVAGNESLTAEMESLQVICNNLTDENSNLKQQLADIRKVRPPANTEVLRPNGSGSETSIDTQYPASGSHWQKVDETSANGDSTYVENKNGAVGSFQRDLYGIQDHSADSNNIINKVTITTWTKFNSPVDSGLKISLKTHGTVYDYDYGAYTQSTWTDISHEMTVNPYNGEAWTFDEVDALEAGVSLGGSTYGPDWSRCTQVYVRVDYS